MPKSTVSATPLITSDHLATISEATLLSIAVALYEVQHPNESGKVAIANAISKSRSHLDQCMTPQNMKSHVAHIGADAWMVIERMVGRRIYQEFINAKEEAQ